MKPMIAVLTAVASLVFLGISLWNNQLAESVMSFLSAAGWLIVFAHEVS